MSITMNIEMIHANIFFNSLIFFLNYKAISVLIVILSWENYPTKKTRRAKISHKEHSERKEKRNRRNTDENGE